MQTEHSDRLGLPQEVDLLHSLCHAFGSLATVREAESALHGWLTGVIFEASVYVHIPDDTGLHGAERVSDHDRRDRVETAIRSKQALVTEIDDTRTRGTFPMVSRGDVFGVVEVEARHHDMRAGGDLIRSIVSQGAIVLRRLRVESELERELADMKDLRDIEVRMASVAHELKGPIIAIRHAIGAALEEGVPDGTASNLLRRSRLELAELDRVIDSLLTPRLHAGENEYVDLLSLALESIEDTKEEADGHSFGLHGEPISVDGNRTRLRIAISNVIRNALRHSPRGSEVTVTVGGDDARAWLKVEDTGPGVGPEDAAAIFQAFGRGSEAAGEGVGLGLFITRTVLESHGGTVRVSRRDDGGAAFLLELPRFMDMGAHRAV